MYLCNPAHAENINFHGIIQNHLELTLIYK